MSITRIFDIVSHYKQAYPDQKTVFAWRESTRHNAPWKRMDVDEYVRTVDTVSYGLLALGLSAGDKVGIVSGNRVEWNMIDFATMQIGAISVPVYPTISQDDYRYILSFSEMRAIFIEGKELRTKIEPLLSQMPHLKYVVTLSRTEDGKYMCYEDLLRLGEENPDPVRLQALKDAVKPKDLATIVFTSGTTGDPKGVMLNHRNILMQLEGVHGIHEGPRCNTLSFLPLCHAYERMMVYFYQYEGWSVYYCRNVGTIAQDIRDANPSVMTCVPRVLEKIYDKLLSAGSKQPAYIRPIYMWAMRLAEQYQYDDRTWWYNLKWRIANALVYKKMRQAIGGSFTEVISGGSAMQPRLTSFFSAIGLPILEGYGLTETSPVIAVARKGYKQRCPGYVGVALPGVEVRLTDENEVVCRGENVMMGYYKNPTMTAEVIDEDGWFHTGDTGEMTTEGLLKITGRKKSFFKTSLGKYVNPEAIEMRCTESPFIENIVVVGEYQRYVTALIVPDYNYVAQWAQQHNLTLSSPKEAAESAELKKVIQAELAAVAKSFGDWEKVQKFTLLTEPWTTDNYLSPTLKVRRKIVQEKFKSEIDAMYA